MADIAPTRIGTSYPLDLCEGVPLFPAVGSIRAYSYGDNKDILPRGSNRILLWRLDRHVQYVFITGLCGPAYAATFVVQGTVNDTEVSLTVSGDEAAAGVFMGMEVDFPLSFGVESGSVHFNWKRGFYTKWKRSFSVSKTPKVDILALLVALIKKLMQEAKKSNDIEKGEKLEGEPRENEEKKPEKKKPKVSVGSWGMFDSIQGTYGQKGAGELTPEPTLTITVNIVPMFPELEAVDKALKTLWGGLSLGPKFKFVVPVHLRMKQVAIDGNALQGVAFSGNRITGSLPAPIDDPGELEVEVDHTVGLTFGTSFFMSISICKCFSFDPETGTLRLDSLFGWEITTKPHCTGFRNTVGSLTLPNATDGPATACEPSRVSVVLEP